MSYNIKLKIHGIIFLHSKEGWVTAISTRLPETKLVYNKGQDTITLNRGSYQQTKRGKIFQ